MFGISMLAGVIEEHNKREAWIASMTEEEQEKIRAKDAQTAHENMLHKRALEIADAGRARNFWGN